MRRLVLMVLLLTAVVMCGRWQPATPRVLNIGDPGLAYEATMAAAHNGSYVVADHNPERGTVTVVAKTGLKGDYPAPGQPAPMDEDLREKMSWITFQAYADGSLHVTATGHHVKPEKGIHKKLAKEIDELVAAVDHYAQQMSAGQPAAAPPATTAPAEPTAPASAPPEPTAPGSTPPAAETAPSATAPAPAR